MHAAGWLFIDIMAVIKICFNIFYYYFQYFSRYCLFVFLFPFFRSVAIFS